MEGKKLLNSQSAIKEAAVADTLRGRFVEEEQSTVGSSSSFSLEDVTVVEQDAEGPSDLQSTTINLDMPSAVSPEDWVGKEVKVEGRFDMPPPGETRRLVFVVEHIDEA